MTPAELRAKGLATPLAERMQVTKPGQATWAEPMMNRNCTNCEHFREHHSGKEFTGTCALYQRRTKHRKTFDGSRAKACMDWEEPL